MHGFGYFIMSSIQDFAPPVACPVSSWTRSSPFKANIMPWQLIGIVTCGSLSHTVVRSVRVYCTRAESTLGTSTTYPMIPAGEAFSHERVGCEPASVSLPFSSSTEDAPRRTSKHALPRPVCRDVCPRACRSRASPLAHAPPSPIPIRIELLTPRRFTRLYVRHRHQLCEFRELVEVDGPAICEDPQTPSR